MREHSFRGATFKTTCERVLNDSFEDEQDVRDRHWHINKDDFVVDAGAAFGSYTLSALALGARVLAFAPETFEELINNVAINPTFSERCDVLPSGLYDMIGWLATGANSYLFYDDEPEQGFRVGPLDDFNFDGVDWIKVDVEGNELHVLRGAEKIIKRFRPKLLIENHLFMNAQIEKDVIEFVQNLDLGYSVETNVYNGVSHSFFEVK